MKITFSYPILLFCKLALISVLPAACFAEDKPLLIAPEMVFRGELHEKQVRDSRFWGGGQIVEKGPNGEEIIILDGPYSRDGEIELNKFKNAILSTCGQSGLECIATETLDKRGLTSYDIKFGDDITLNFSLDPLCIEVIPKGPLSVESWRKLEPIIEKNVFDVAKKNGFRTPKLFANGMHINIDFERLRSDQKLARNFLVDFANHTELYTGALFEDNYNALGFAMTPDKRTKLANIIKMFDAGTIDADEMYYEVFKKIYENKEFGKFQALGLHFKNEYEGKKVIKRFVGRLELRSIRQTENFSDAVGLFTLFEKRMNYLSTLEKPVALDMNPKIYGKFYDKVAAQEFLNSSKGLLKNKMNPYLKSFFIADRKLREKKQREFKEYSKQFKKFKPTLVQYLKNPPHLNEGIEKYKAYIEESGLNFNDYVKYLPWYWQRSVPYSAKRSECLMMTLSRVMGL